MTEQCTVIIGRQPSISLSGWIQSYLLFYLSKYLAIQSFIFLDIQLSNIIFSQISSYLAFYHAFRWVSTISSYLELYGLMPIYVSISSQISSYLVLYRIIQLDSILWKSSYLVFQLTFCLDIYSKLEFYLLRYVAFQSFFFLDIQLSCYLLDIQLSSIISRFLLDIFREYTTGIVMV